MEEGWASLSVGEWTSLRDLELATISQPQLPHKVVVRLSGGTVYSLEEEQYNL